MHVISANHREVEWPSCRHREGYLYPEAILDGTGIPTTSMFPLRVKNQLGPSDLKEASVFSSGIKVIRSTSQPYS
jgi:hypothetical protein